MPVHLIALDKYPGVSPVGIGETWIRLFDKCVLEVTAHEATNLCQDGHIYDELKVGIYGDVHNAQYIWDDNSFS